MGDGVAVRYITLSVEQTAVFLINVFANVIFPPPRSSFYSYSSFTLTQTGSAPLAINYKSDRSMMCLFTDEKQETARKITCKWSDFVANTSSFSFFLSFCVPP